MKKFVFYVLHLSWPSGYCSHLAGNAQPFWLPAHLARHWHEPFIDEVKRCLAGGGRIDVTHIGKARPPGARGPFKQDIYQPEICSICRGEPPLIDYTPAPEQLEAIRAKSAHLDTSGHYERYWAKQHDRASSLGRG